MNKFMVWSDVGNALGAVVKLQAEGNDTAWWCKDPSASSVGKNMVESVYDWKFTPDDDTIHCMDCTNYGAFADSLRVGGLPVVGSSLIADRMEMDRAFSKKVFAECGIPTPPSVFFTDWHKGEEYVKAHKGVRMAIKPGESLSGNLPSHVADKNFPSEDLLGILD
ncbi:MAG TPA: hypothetical protein VMW38_06410, partial [Terriglobia bacterium]|nr:hypothetical protein [Terriglobia bacterium]